MNRPLWCQGGLACSESGTKNERHGSDGARWVSLHKEDYMSQSDGLLLRAVRKAAESLNDALQVILLEGALLARDGRLEVASAERLTRLMAAAGKAASLSRCIFGVDELVCTAEVTPSAEAVRQLPGVDPQKARSNPDP